MRNSCIFIQENAFENVVCEMTAILSWPQCVKQATIKLFISLIVVFILYINRRLNHHLVRAHSSMSLMLWGLCFAKYSSSMQPFMGYFWSITVPLKALFYSTCLEMRLYELTHWGRDIMANILKAVFLRELYFQLWILLMLSQNFSQSLLCIHVEKYLLSNL